MTVSATDYRSCMTPLYGKKPEEGARENPKRPYETLARFDPATHWDLDSTPDNLRQLSRTLGFRDGAIEAAIVMASLRHDIRYYYGGTGGGWSLWSGDKEAADKAFRGEIIDFAGRLSDNDLKARLVADVDFAAVTVGGVPELNKPYSWSYGLSGPKGYFGISDAERAQIQTFANNTFADVVHQLATGSFVFTPQQEKILTPEIKRELKNLALQLDGERKMAEQGQGLKSCFEPSVRSRSLSLTGE